MKQYEAVFILNEQKCEDGGEKYVQGTVEPQIAGLGGKVVDVESLGRRQLTHPINRRHTGLYWDVTLVLPPSKLSLFREAYRLDQHVLRMEVFVDERPPPKPPAEDEEESR